MYSFVRGFIGVFHFCHKFSSLVENSSIDSFFVFCFYLFSTFFVVMVL